MCFQHILKSSLAGVGTALVAVVAAAPAARGDGGFPPYLRERIVHAPWQVSRLGDDDELQRALDYLREAKAAGFNAVVLGHVSELALPSRAGEEYIRRLRRVGELAQELGLKVIPYAVNFGSGDALFRYEPNLAEGLPVRDALFQVTGRQAVLVPDPPVTVENPNFDEAQGNHLVGWRAERGREGEAIFADGEVRHAGACSLRIEASKADAPGGGIWIAQDIAIRPFRQYRARVWVKSEGLTPGCVVKVAFWTGKRHLHHGGIGVKETQDWTRHTAVFNSLDNAAVTVRVGIDYGASGGRCWIDSLTIEEIGPLNILRRPGCPLVVRGENGAVYEESRDFEPLSDPMLYALHPWGGWSLDHDPPVLRLTGRSRIADGERLRVSYYHALPVYENQVAMCMSCDRPYELFQQGVRELQALLRPAGYHISIGEIRNANWDEDCRRRNLSPAQILADSVQRCIAIIRKIDPQAQIYGWSDMLDPWHNATDNYYLANGSFEGTADLVPRDVIILNWNYSAHDGASPRFFAEKGFTQLLVGTTGEDVATYLRSNPDLPNLIGVYALEPASPAAFAKAVWGNPGGQP